MWESATTLISEYLFWVLLSVICIFAIGKWIINFDLNRFLEKRRENQKEKLIMLCTHTEISFLKDGKIIIQPLFVTFPGTTQYQCQRCGRWTSEFEINRIREYWSNNIKQCLKQEKEFSKLHKKIYK